MITLLAINETLNNLELESKNIINQVNSRAFSTVSKDKKINMVKGFIATTNIVDKIKDSNLPIESNIDLVDIEIEQSKIFNNIINSIN